MTTKRITTTTEIEGVKAFKKSSEIEIEGTNERRFIPEVRFDDQRFIPNKGKLGDGKPGIKISANLVTVIPAQVQGNYAVLLLSGEQYYNLLSSGVVVIPADVDTTSTGFPLLAQRTVTNERIKGIHTGWKNPTLTPEGYAEKIELYAYGCTLDNKGIHLTLGKSLLCIGDGGGRSGAHYAEPDVANERDIQWLLMIGLKGSKANMLAAFRKQVDAKKLSKGTVMGSEVGMLDEIDYEPENCDEKLFPSWAARELFDNHRDEGSWLWLTGWSTQAGVMEEELRHGKGNITSLRTVLEDKKIVRMMTESGYSPCEMIEVLDFGLRQAMLVCRAARKDAIINKGAKGRFHTSLALKVIVWFTLKCYKQSGSDPYAFESLVNKIMTEYYKNRKGEDFPEHTKLKKVSWDNMFMCNTFFSSEKFNSGQQNAAVLLSHLERAAEIASK